MTWWCGPAEAQPGVEARPDAGVRPEVAVGHLEARQLLRVEHLALGDDQPEAIAAEREERGDRRRPRLVLEEDRRRVGQPADAERPLDQARLAVRARDAPVALAHVAHEDRVAGEVHRVHLGEVRVAEQLVPGRDQRRGERVALARRSRSPCAISVEAAAIGSRAKRPSSAIASKCVEYARQPRSRRMRSSAICMRMWSSRSSSLSAGSISKRSSSSAIAASIASRSTASTPRYRSPGAM